MTTRKIIVELSEELIARIDKESRNRSEFIRQAIAVELMRIEAHKQNLELVEAYRANAAEMATLEKEIEAKH